MFITGGPTDTSQSYAFTDWAKVDEFAKELNVNFKNRCKPPYFH